MAEIKISALPLVGGATLADVLPEVQSGVTYKVTLLEIQTLFNITALSKLELAILGLGGTADISAILDMQSTALGFLPPRMTTAQRNAIPTPATGLTIFNLTSLDTETYNGSIWVGSTASGVTTIAGAGNQIVASSPTGSVTLSLSPTLNLPGTLECDGIAGFGAAPATNSQLKVTVFEFAPRAYGINVAGTTIGTGVPIGILNNIRMIPGTNGTDCHGLYSSPTIISNTGYSLNLCTSIYADLIMSTNIGNIDTLSAIYVGPGSPPSSGTITRAYGLFVRKPYLGMGSNIICANFEDIVCIGTTTPTPSAVALLQIDSTTHGILPPRMTTTQKNAITAVEGLTLYDTVLHDLQYYNGTTWVSGAGVTTVTGTAYQIATSAASGNITLTLDPLGLSFGIYAGYVPPTSGLIVAGLVGVHTAAPDANSNMNIDMALRNGLLIDGATIVGAGPINGILVNATFSAQASTNCIGVASAVKFAAPGAYTYSLCIGLYAFNDLSANAGTLTNSIGLYVDTGTTQTGVVTNGYGIYCRHPAGGNNKVCAYFEDVVTIGTITPSAVAILQADSTTKGFLPPRMTTTQKNAITAIAGLQVYDSTLNDLQFYNGSSWIATGGVTSAAATSNQLAVSGATGAVTFSLASAIITPGTIAINSMTTGSILFTGASSVVTQSNATLFWDDTNKILGIGTATPSSLSRATFSSANAYNLYLTGTQTAVGSYQSALNIDSTMSPTVNNTSIFSLFFQTNATPQGTNTILEHYGLYVSINNTPASGAINLAVGGAFVEPSGTAATKVALYSDNLAVGIPGTAPPSNGAFFGGNVVVGDSVATARTALSVVTATSYSGNVIANQINIGGQITMSTPSISSAARALSIDTKYIASSAQTLPAANGIYISMDMSSNGGTIQGASGLFISTGITATNTVSRAYGAYINSQLCGTTQTNVGLYLYGSDASSSTRGTSSLAKLDGFITGSESTTIYGINNKVTLNPTTGNVNVYGNYNGVTAATRLFNTIPTAIAVYGLMTTDITSGGTIENAYSGYFAAPTGGDIAVALYAANLIVGTTGISPPSNGAIINGQLGVGVSSVNFFSKCQLDSSNANQLLLGGTTQTEVDGSNYQTAINTSPVFAPTDGSTISAGIYCKILLGVPTTKTTTTMAAMYLSNGASSYAGSVTTLAGVYFDGGLGGLSNITNAYGGYFAAPASGTNKCAMYTANLSVGVVASGTPTAGTIRTAPPASATAISFGSSLTLGTALQNTLGYDILVSVCVVVSAATSANFQIGVGSTNTPTKNDILPAAISAAETFTVSVIVPHNYYVLLDKTGTSSTSTNKLIVTAI